MFPKIDSNGFIRDQENTCYIAIFDKDVRAEDPGSLKYRLITDPASRDQLYKDVNKRDPDFGSVTHGLVATWQNVWPFDSSHSYEV